MIKLEAKHVGRRCTISGRYAGYTYVIAGITADKKSAFVEQYPRDERLRPKFRYEEIPADQINLLADVKEDAA